MTLDEEIKDVLECIAKFDPDETLKNKGRYFEVIRKDAKKLLDRIKKK
jgi:hypothetical protein